MSFLNKNLTILLIAIIVIVLAIVALKSPQEANTDTTVDRKEFDIGTGSYTGVYWPVGSAIAELVNNNPNNKSIKLSASSTGGSVFNGKATLQGEMDFSIIQSDIQYQIYTGEGNWSKIPNHQDLRVVMDLHFETVTLVVAEDAQIYSFKDLLGKKVNLGNIGSGQRKNAIDLFNFFGIDYENDIEAESVKAGDSAQLFQDGRIDAFFFTAGHPNGLVKQVFAGNRKAKILNINVSDQFFQKFPYYKKAKISKISYKGDLNEDIHSIGVRASLCTKASMDPQIVYNICQAVINNFSKFKEKHSTLETLEINDLGSSTTIPLHIGADKFFIQK